MTVFEMNNAISNARSSMDVYAMYVRKSRADREDETVEEVVQRHKKILTDLAARKGLFVGEIYQEVVSGETIEARTEIQRLIKDCYDGKYRGILVVEVTRLSRGNQGDMQTILDTLKYGNRNKGLLVITPTRDYDVAHNSDDEEYMEFELFMSRREYKMINKRMNRGKLQCVVEGEFMGSHRPYGWNIVDTDEGRTLFPNETEFEIGKLMYKWRAEEGLTPYRIAQRLTTMGIPTYKGGSEWSKETVKDFLRNPANMGKVRYNDRMQVKSMKGGVLVTSRPRSNHTDHYMLYDGKHKHRAMVDEETFRLANKDFKSDRTRSNLKLTNPLAGLLCCQKCGKILHFQSYGKRDNTSPRYIHPQSQVCKVKSALASDVINAVAHSLQMYIEDFKLKVNGMPAVNEDTVTMQIEALQKEIRKVKRILGKLFDDYENEIYTANEFVERKAKHNEKLESIQKQIATLEQSIPEKEEYEDKIMRLYDALTALQDETLDAEVKNQYLKAIVDKIEFSRENSDEFILDVYLK